MNSKNTFSSFKPLISKTVIGLLLVGTLFIQTFAQTAADTVIQNQASATYSDGNGNNFSTVSNTVSITVAKVAGLRITPDGQTNTSVVPGQTGVNFCLSRHQYR
jgi:ACR3 family arsenite efflux pump ArsB